MEVAMPMSGSAIDCYEDMFKEITRKLYGEDGLPELPSNDRHSNSQERGLTPIDYDVETPLLKPEEHITAFGLAALMQNGFPPTGILNSTFQPCKPNFNYEDKWIISEDSIQWTQSKIASYNPAQKLFKCAECDCVGYLHRVTEHWLGTHSNLRAFQCPQCPYESAWARCVRIHLSRQHNINSEETTDILLKNNPVVQEISRYLQCLKTKLENNSTKAQNGTAVLDDIHSANSTINGGSNTRMLANQSTSSGETANTTPNSTKRYNCTYCPYATDRRDLFTRHENIHREEKPFQCYVCQKQFNRADHVKKHFLRMHREHPYDLNRIRRHPPKNSSGMSFYQKYNSTMSTNDISESVTNNLGLNNSLSIPNSFNSRNVSALRTSNTSDLKNTSFKSSMLSKSSGKKKGEKRFTCCYCTWSGVDNWCLKRHMNTHLKPFVCGLCDYKAARSERLATHVLKVHNKRACGKCTFLADDPAQLATHQQEHHPLEQRSNRNNSTTNQRTNNYSNGSASLTSNSFSQPNQINPKQHDFNTGAPSYLHHPNRLLPESKPWKSHSPKQHGAARLFSYMEASDGSDPECDSQSVEDMNRVGLSHRLQSDFLEAGDVGIALDEVEGEDMELPLFICATCGCEFEDDRSLETHQYTHHHMTTSPAKIKDQKDQTNGTRNYRCCVCDYTFTTQTAVMTHMQSHTNLISVTTNIDYTQDKENQNKRSRKQSQPKKVLVPFLENDEINLQFKGKNYPSNKNMDLVEKYVTKLVNRKRYTCYKCSNFKVCQFASKAKLMFHQYWKHRNHYECEHCNMMFRHRYQAVLHSSREHINQPQRKSSPNKTDVVPLKEFFNSNETISDDSHNFLGNALANNASDIINPSVHKLGVSLFDHSFLHSNSGINNHMPLIIPTFPPN